MMLPRPTRLLGWTLLGFLAVCGASADEMDRVLGRYVESMGGRGRISEISSIVIEGTYTHSNGSVSQLRVMKKRPNLVRSVLIRPNGMTFINGYDGTTAWQHRISGATESAQPVEGDIATAFIRDAPIESPLSAEKADHFKVSYLGTVELDNGAIGHHLKVAYDDGTWVEHFIDARDYFERKTIKHSTIGGQAVVETSYPNDFNYVDGVAFAFQVDFVDAEGARSALKINKIRINPGLVNSLFQMPRIEPPPGTGG